MKKIFEDLYIYNSHNSKELIINYPVLCYLIFKISKSLFDNKLWHTDYKTNKFTMEDHLQIIHTMIDIINHLVKIKDLKLEAELYKKNIKMYQEHITRIEALNKAYEKKNSQLEKQIKELKDKIKDDAELIQDLYEYP